LKNLYVGNIEQGTTVDDLRAAFATYGPVEAVAIVADKATGLPRGFGFVEMTVEKDANEAILGLNGSVIGGQAITVNEARAKTKRA
jgi:RNA recognition motif-containing protein